MTASWVEHTSRICEVWRDGEQSIRDHFQAAGPDLSDQQAFTDAIAFYLNAHHGLCDRWQHYVDDKRWTPSPLLDLRGPTTAWMTTKGQRFCHRAFDSAVAACSHFLWMEANWVLRQARTWAESVPTTELAQLAELAPKDAFDARLEQFRAAEGLEHGDAIDVVALVAAQQFLDGSISFDKGDQILNLLWIRITDDLVEHGADSPMPELAYKVYDAFDAGEYHHGDGKDPVTTYTVPALRDVVAEFGA